MRYSLLTTISFLFFLTSAFSQRQKESNVQRADAYYLDYHFQEAAVIYKDLMQKTPSTDSLYILLKSKYEKASWASRMLTAVEDIQLVDSIRVPKAVFFSYYKMKDNVGRIFSNKKLNDSINGLPLTGYISQREDRIFISDTLHGQTDIFSAYKLLDGWSEKKALSVVINTEANENFPFLLSDGISLYYSSDGEGSLGGYDIFMTRFSSDNNDFLLSQNIGMPFNSPFNDYLLAIDDESKLGWFATDRYQQEDTVIIYTFKPNEKRTFVASDDSDYVVNVAKLKTYKLFSRDTALLDSVDAVLVSSPSSLKSMHFIINDSTVYSSKSQFISNDARIAYETAIENELKLKENEQKLEQLRNEYAVLKTKEEQNKLVFQIKSLEIENNKLRILPGIYLKKARNLENKENSDYIIR